MTRSGERAGPGARLLLLAALLLGIVTMHSLGHPADSHAVEDAPAGRSVASAGHTRGAERVHAQGQAQGPAQDPIPVAGAPLPAAAVGITNAAGTGTGTGMDPMSVCLAVLTGLVLLYLGAGPAGSRDTAPLGGAARIPGRSGGPGPSPRELLTRLAVLRV
ncbi:hypothetical protein [Streptomyces sp. NPDC023588]|uniref:hypothetical protein n=1 Tax=Streptomyces sp. NPDC023588 TaxID=3154907 RepID=UPI0033CCA258